MHDSRTSGKILKEHLLPLFVKIRSRRQEEGIFVPCLTCMEISVDWADVVDGALAFLRQSIRDKCLPE